MKKKRTAKAGAYADFQAAFAGLKAIFQRRRDKLTSLAVMPARLMLIPGV